MKTRLWLGLALLAWAPAANAAPSRPNILFLFADDHRADAIGAAGNPHIRTPNLDALWRRGFHFSRAYCMGSPHAAVCQPSRAMLMSGRGLYRAPLDLAGVPTLGQVLRQAGYETFATGKWHNGRPSFLATFPRGKSIFFGGMADHTRLPLADVGPDGALTNERMADRFSSEVFADAAIEFLRSYRGEKPFFAYVAFTAPHDPRQPPPSYRETYYRHRPPLPANFLPQHPFDPGGLGTMRDESLAGWPRDPAILSDQLAEYYGLITHLDEQVGRILRALAAGPYARNTIVIYSADHGLAMGSHGLLGKQSLYEHSMRAPLILAGADIPRGRGSPALVYLHDLFPTIADLAGAQVPAGVEGKTLRPLWQGKASRLRDTVFTSFGTTIRAIRDDRWKLIRYPEIDRTQLFDLTRDPHERHDQAEDPRQRARVARLIELLGRAQLQAGDRQRLHVERPRSGQADFTSISRVPDKWQPRWIVEKYFPRAPGEEAGR